MAIFEEILKPEETLGGFIPGETDDDVFILESKGNYPGVIPDFVPEQTLAMAEPEEVVASGDMAPLYSVPDAGDVWSVFCEGEHNTVPDQANTQENISDIALSDTSETDALADELLDFAKEEGIGNSAFTEQSEGAMRDIQDIDVPEFANFANTIEAEEAPAPAMAEMAPEEISIGTAINPEDVVESATPGFNPEEYFTPAEAAPAVAPTLVLDDDFLSSLKQDLSSEKPARAKKAAEPTNEIPAMAEDLPIDNSKEAQVIDLTDFNTDAPSKQSGDEFTLPPAEVLSETEAKAKAAEETKAAKAQAKAEKAQAKAEKKEKNKYVWFAFKVAALVGAGLFVIGAVGFIFWNKFILTNLNEKHKEEVRLEKLAENNYKMPGNDNEKAEAKPVEPAPIAQDTVKPAESPKEEPKPVAEPIAKAAPEPKKKIIEEKPKPVAVAKVTKPVTKPVAKPKLAVETKKPKQTVVKNDEAGAVYSVQVYASPSKADADAWLKKLKSKNISGAYISPQKKRDQIWYRVRFGNYSTKEDARSAAVKLGYAQSWIDRIK